MKKVFPDIYGENKGHYSPAIISQGMLYISGQLSVDMRTRQVAAGGIDEHMRLALRNLDIILRSANLSRDNVVQCRIYIADIEHWDAVNDIYKDFFGGHMPARVIVPVGRLHFGCLVEIEAVAECPDEQCKDE